jgi:hypothetical protein
MPKHGRISLFVAAFLLTAGLASGFTAITNGSFETGDFTGWTQIPASSGSNFGVSNAVTAIAAPQSGSYYAFFNSQPNNYDSISQTLTTTPGELYGITFLILFLTGNDGSNQDFRVLWNGSLSTGVINENPNPPFGPFYVPITDSVIANGNSTVLEFQGFDGTGETLLDNISIRDLGAAIPEPGTFGLSGAGLVIAGFCRQIKRKAIRRTLN